MIMYEFLKTGTPFNVDFDAENGRIHCFEARFGSRNCIHGMMDFVKFYEAALNQYAELHQISELYVMIFHDKGDISDEIRFYKDWVSCETEGRGVPHIYPRRLNIQDVETYIQLFKTKDFTLERFERQMYYDEQNRQKNAKEKAEKKAIDARAQKAKDAVVDEMLSLDQQMNISDFVEPKPKKKRGRPKKSDQKKEVLSLIVKKEDLPPWETVEERIERLSKENKDEVVTVQISVSVGDLKKIIKKYPVKLLDDNGFKSADQFFSEM